MSNDASLPVSTKNPYGHTVLAEVTRGDLVESVHWGSYSVVTPSGEIVLSGGAPEAAVYARSSLKPFQLLAMMRLGLDLPIDLTSLASASHSGEPMHIDGVERMLSMHGLNVEVLGTPADVPTESAAYREWVRQGNESSSIAHNCSGKHAAMLSTCQLNGWPLENYLDPQHPLQKHIAETIAELTGEQAAAVTVDGCGAPLFAYSLNGLARAFAVFAAATDGTAEARIAQALKAHPLLMSGSGSTDVLLMESISALFTKGGAEAVQLAGVTESDFGPVGIAVKIADGGYRARLPVMAPLLQKIGVPAEEVQKISTIDVLGGGKPVGEVRAAEPLLRELGLTA